MAGIDQYTLLNNLANDLFWGVVKAEKRMTGRTSVYSKMVGDEMCNMFLGALEEFGLKVEPKATPVETLLNYLDVLKTAGGFSPEDIEVKPIENGLEITVKKCPFAVACSKLITEGINEFGCIQQALFTLVANKSGKNLTGKSMNSPGSCQIHFETK